MGEYDIIYLIPPVLTIYFSSYLAVVSIYKSRKTLNLLLSLICFIWSLTSIAYVAHQFADTTEQFILIEKIVHSLFCFGPWLHLLFFYNLYDGKISTGIKNNKFSICIFLTGLGFSFLAYSDYYVVGINKYHWGYIAKAGVAFYYFLLFSVFVVFCIVAGAVKQLIKEQNHILRLKIKYTLFSFSIACILTMLNALPLSGYGLYPMGNFIFIPLSFLAYGVLKYRILNLKSIFLIGFQYLLEILLLSLPNTIVFLILLPYLRESNFSRLVIIFLVWFYLNSYILIKIRFAINVLVDREKYKLKNAETQFIDNILPLKNIDDLKNEFVTIVNEALGFTIVNFFVMSAVKGDLLTISGKKLTLTPELYSWFVKTKHLSERNMVSTNPYYDSLRTQLLQLFDEQQCNIIIPMVQYDELVGMALFSCEITGITRREVTFINRIKKFVVIAIYNAIIYQDVNSLKENLEEKTKKLSTEIIERQNAENVLIESEARYRLLAENIIDTI